MWDSVWRLATKLDLILIKLKIVTKFQTVTICIKILIKFDRNINLFKLMIVRIFQWSAVGFQSLRIEHGRFNKIFNCKFNCFTTFFDINFEIKPLKMIFCIWVWFHVQIILVRFDSLNNLHIARLEIRLETQIILLANRILNSSAEYDIFGFLESIQIIYPLRMYRIIDILRTACDKCKLISILPKYIITLLCNCSPGSWAWFIIIFY